MATYDYAPGAMAENTKMFGYSEGRGCFIVKRKFNVATVIAWNATLTAAAKITSADVFKVIGVPDDTLFMNVSGMKIITAFGACTDIDMGRAGGDEIIDGLNPAGATAGNHLITVHGDDWGTDTLCGYVFVAADTIDITFKADETTGHALIWAVLFDVSDNVGED